MPPKGLNDIPAEAIDVDPATFDPLWLGLAQEGRKRVVVQSLDGQVIFGEVDDGDVARGAQGRHGGMTAIRFARVHAWLGAGCRSLRSVTTKAMVEWGCRDGHTMPARAGGEILKIIDRSKSSGAGRTPKGSGAGRAAPEAGTQCGFGVAVGEGGLDGIRRRTEACSAANSGIDARCIVHMGACPAAG